MVWVLLCSGLAVSVVGWVGIMVGRRVRCRREEAACVHLVCIVYVGYCK